MALFTKLFERNFNPYDIPGARWYKVHVTSNGTNITIDFAKSDLPDTQIGVDGVRNIRIGNTPTSPKVFTVIDYVVDFRSTQGTSGTFTKLVNVFAAADVYSVQLPVAARYSELDLYLYLKEV